MNRSLMSLLFAVYSSLSACCEAAIVSPPTFDQLASAETIIFVKAENLHTSVGERREPIFRLENVVYLKGAGPSSLTIRLQLGWMPPADHYLIFLDRKQPDSFRLINNYLSVIPAATLAGDFKENAARALGLTLAEGIVHLKDPAARNMSSLLLAHAPSSIRQEAWKIVSESVINQKWNESAESMLPIFHLAVYSEGIKAFYLLPSKGAEQIFPDAIQASGGKLEMPRYQHELESSLVTWITKNCSRENADILIPFALAQPPEYSAGMLSGFAHKSPIAFAPVIFARMVSSRSTREQYACMRVFANMYERSDLVPTLEDFMKQPQAYLSTVRVLAEEQRLH